MRPARIISPEASPTMPTGKVCCLYCYLASLYKRSLQANNVFLLLCIRGDKCASVTHDQWVRVRSIVSNIEKTCDECTQRSTTRHLCHCTPTHKHVLLMILHIPQASTCRRRARTSLICADRRDTGARWGREHGKAAPSAPASAAVASLSTQATGEPHHTRVSNGLPPPAPARQQHLERRARA